MPSLRRSKPKTVTDRVKTAGAAAGDVSKAVGKSASSGLESTRGKAAAAVGVAAGTAGAVAFWKRSQGDEPDIQFDPKVGEPTSVTTTETPEAKAAKEAASSANGDSS